MPEAVCMYSTLPIPIPSWPYPNPCHDVYSWCQLDAQYLLPQLLGTVTIRIPRCSPAIVSIAMPRTVYCWCCKPKIPDPRHHVLPFIPRTTCLTLSMVRRCFSSQWRYFISEAIPKSLGKEVELSSNAQAATKGCKSHSHIPHIISVPGEPMPSPGLYTSMSVERPYMQAKHTEIKIKQKLKC